MTYSLEEDVENGFIIEGFDLRKYADEIIHNNPNFTFVIDKSTWNKQVWKAKKQKL